jgi:phospholipid transport system substrate-binding protein
MRSSVLSWRFGGRGRVLLALCALSLIAAGAAAQPATQPTTQPAANPTDLIQRLSDRVVAILGDHDMSKADKRHQVQELAYANIDFLTLGRLTLGAAWRPLTPEQRRDFIDQFRTHLANTYRSMIDNYKDETVNMAGVRDEGRGDFLVKTNVVNPHTSEAFEVNYRVRGSAGNWKIIDITIEGVDLVVNFREQFKEILDNGGFDHLMQVLRDKNAGAEKDTGQ